MLFQAAAFLLTALGVMTLALGLFWADRRGAFGVALELWTGAGLLGLSGDPSAQTLLSAALILLVRRLVIRALPALARPADHVRRRSHAGAGVALTTTDVPTRDLAARDSEAGRRP